MNETKNLPTIFPRLVTGCTVLVEGTVYRYNLMYPSRQCVFEPIEEYSNNKTLSNMKGIKIKTEQQVANFILSGKIQIIDDGLSALNKK